MTKIVTASYLMIGDEILSGRTPDDNLNFLALGLTEIGIDLQEVRVVKDNLNQIITAIRDLHGKYDYIFTTGGIGPTHDDITCEAIAKAINDDLVKNLEAEQILIDYYGSKNLNKSRLKMAVLPSKAKLLDNPISSAPGFIVDNIIVMAGVPKIMRAMFNAALEFLERGDKIYSKELVLNVTESVIAKDLSILQDKFSNVSMGSYPFAGGTAIVFRSSSESDLDQSYNLMLKNNYEG